MDFAHTLSIKRLAVTQDAVGGQNRTYTTAARGALPTSVRARAILMNPREKLEHGVRGEKLGWKFLIETDPQIGLEDRIDFDYVTGQSHTVKVLVGSHARSADSRFWRVIGEEDTTEQ